MFCFRIDWSELYDKDHYKTQEIVYARERPTLLSNTLVVPTQKIREHIRELAANDYYGLRQQVEAFHRTDDGSRHRSSLIPVETMNYLQTYTIEVFSFLLFPHELLIDCLLGETSWK